MRQLILLTENQNMKQNGKGIEETFCKILRGYQA